MCSKESVNLKPGDSILLFASVLKGGVEVNFRPTNDGLGQLALKSLRGKFARIQNDDWGKQWPRLMKACHKPARMEESVAY